MFGSSRTSFAEARDALLARAESPGFEQVGGELLGASTVLASYTALRWGLADTGRSVEDRVGLARTVFSGRVGDTTVELLAEVAKRRWTSPGDLVHAVEALGIEAMLIIAERAGRIDTVEDELFRIDRLVAGDTRLRQALSDPAVPDESKAALLGELLDGRVAQETSALVRHVVAHPRGRRLERALDELVEASARRRERVLARVRVAVSMTDDQQRRLAAALSRVYGRAVDVQIDVDPDVLGGVVVTVGDEVIDGSVATKLEQIRRLMGVN